MIGPTESNIGETTIPRKQVTISNVIDNMADMSGENYEEVQHPDGKVRLIGTDHWGGGGIETIT